MFLQKKKNYLLQKVVILDINVEAGKRIVSGIEKSYNEKKVHFIYADVSNQKQITGELEIFSIAHINNLFDIYKMLMIEMYNKINIFTNYIILYLFIY